MADKTQKIKDLVFHKDLQRYKISAGGVDVIRLLTKKECANYIGVTIETIDKWRREGRITYVKLGPEVNSQVRFDMVDVRDFVERRKHNTFNRGHMEGIHRKRGFVPGKLGVAIKKGEVDPIEGDWDPEYSDNRDNTDAPPDFY